MWRNEWGVVGSGCGRLTETEEVWVGSGDGAADGEGSEGARGRDVGTIGGGEREEGEGGSREDAADNDAAEQFLQQGDASSDRAWDEEGVSGADTDDQSGNFAADTEGDRGGHKRVVPGTVLGVWGVFVVGDAMRVSGTWCGGNRRGGGVRGEGVGREGASVGWALMGADVCGGMAEGHRGEIAATAGEVDHDEAGDIDLSTAAGSIPDGGEAGTAGEVFVGWRCVGGKGCGRGMVRGRGRGRGGCGGVTTWYGWGGCRRRFGVRSRGTSFRRSRTRAATCLSRWIRRSSTGWKSTWR